MKIMITSPRGHHECDVAPEVGKAIFEKMIGVNQAALDKELRTSVPENFAELEALWRAGNPGYSAFAAAGGGDFTAVKKFDPEAPELLFIAPIAGG